MSSEGSPDRPGAAGRQRQAKHLPVLLHETIEQLDLRAGLTVVDGTVGAGGHSSRIVERIGPDGLLIGLDRDPMMLAHARRVLPQDNVHLHHSSYSRLPDILQLENLTAVDRILLDLGLSSDQLEDAGRGFSFHADGPLDLRFDTTTGEPASELLGRLSKDELTELFQTSGEERFAARIATALAAARSSGLPETAAGIADIIRSAVPPASRQQHRDPATRVFQALRIAVNEELVHLQNTLSQVLYQTLTEGGRAVVITFHSLEDRLVKAAFRDKNRWQDLTPRPITARPAEIRLNPRSRTAKIRAVRKT